MKMHRLNQINKSKKIELKSLNMPILNNDILFIMPPKKSTGKPTFSIADKIKATMEARRKQEEELKKTRRR